VENRGGESVGSIKGSRVIVFNFAEIPMDVACCGTDSPFLEPVGDLGKRQAFAAQFANVARYRSSLPRPGLAGTASASASNRS